MTLPSPAVVEDDGRFWVHSNGKPYREIDADGKTVIEGTMFEADVFETRAEAEAFLAGLTDRHLTEEN
jgi:hypothetical protein